LINFLDSRKSRQTAKSKALKSKGIVQQTTINTPITISKVKELVMEEVKKEEKAQDAADSRIEEIMGNLPDSKKITENKVPDSKIVEITEIRIAEKLGEKVHLEKLEALEAEKEENLRQIAEAIKLAEKPEIEKIEKKDSHQGLASKIEIEST
jgi:hypothetical protein